MRFESRYWETSYRGPLWIQAGATVPDEKLINDIENRYKEFYKGVDIEFPARYPTGVLLGVIDL